MKGALSIADRACLPAIAAMAALNLLFLASFVVVALMATSQARATEATACTGTDLLADLQQSDPALFAKITKEADATPNGKGLLWKVEKQGQEPSFLFGTMHMTDPRVVSLTPAAQQAFDAAGTVVIETTDILDQKSMMAAIVREPELTMFTDDTTLTSLLSPQDAELVAKALDKRGIPLASVAKMKPWILSAMVALPACEMARKAGGAPVLDIKLAEDAKAAGKSLEGLETIADQLGAMASLPIAFHMQGLVETLKLGTRIDDVIETMIVLYGQGYTGMIWPLFHAVLPGGDGDQDYADFEETMVTARNRVMAERAMPILAKGNAFIAVGALHLPGQEGLVELLRLRGYEMSPVN